jgi:hypothetical protein
MALDPGSIGKSTRLLAFDVFTEVDVTSSVEQLEASKDDEVPDVDTVFALVLHPRRQRRQLTYNGTPIIWKAIGSLPKLQYVHLSFPSRTYSISAEFLATYLVQPTEGTLRKFSLFHGSLAGNISILAQALRGHASLESFHLEAILPGRETEEDEMDSHTDLAPLIQVLPTIPNLQEVALVDVLFSHAENENKLAVQKVITFLKDLMMINDSPSSSASHKKQHSPD